MLILYQYGNRLSIGKSYLVKINQIIFNTLNILKYHHHVLKILILISLSFIIVNITYATIIEGLDIKSNISIIIIFTLFLRISKIITITPGNIGVNEFIFGFIGSSLNIGFSNGILISMIYRFIAYSSIIIFGIIFSGVDFIKNNKVQ